MADRFRILGDSGTNFNDTQYWSTLSGGVGGASVPTSIDVARFDASSGNCTCEVNIDLSGLKLEAGYASTFSYGTKIGIVRAGNALIDAGTYNMGTNSATFSGTYIQNGGTVTATSGSLAAWSTFKVLGGTFDPNGGVFRLDGASQTVDIQNDVMNEIFFSMTGAAALTIVEKMTFVDINMGGALGRIVSGTLEFSGDMFGIGGSTSSGSMGGTIKAIGVNQSISSTSIIGISANFECALSGTLTLSDEIRLGAGWKYTSGIVDFGTSLIDFRGATTTYTVDFGDQNSLHDMTATHTGTRTLTGAIIVTNNLIVTNARAWNGGTIELQGNIDIGSGNWQGTTAILINGTALQTVVTNGSLGRFTDGTITINKISGDLRLDEALITDGTGQDISFLAGVLDLNGNDLTISDVWTVAAGARIKARGDEIVTVNGSDSIDNASIHEFYDSTVTAMMDNISTTYGNIELGDDKTHNVTDTATLTVNGTLSSNAASTSTRSILRSTNEGTQWSLILNGTSTLADLVDVQDSDASGGLPVDAIDSIGENQNNDNWNFGGGVSSGRLLVTQVI